jgi:hypothetical protein
MTERTLRAAPDASYADAAASGRRIGYYGRFANLLPTSPNYLPIDVWGSYNHTQANRDVDAAAGLNLY